MEEDTALAREMVEEEIAEILEEEQRFYDEVNVDDLIALQANEELLFQDLMEEAEESNEDEVEVIGFEDDDEDYEVIDLVSDGE